MQQFKNATIKTLQNRKTQIAENLYQNAEGGREVERREKKRKEKRARERGRAIEGGRVIEKQKLTTNKQTNKNTQITFII